jgi:hypothetical protein
VSPIENVKEEEDEEEEEEEEGKNFWVVPACFLPLCRQ